jgi:RHS repeat-associated protein
VHQVFDCAGVGTSAAYDFKGNLLQSTRQLVQDYKNTPDWAQQLVLEEAIFTSHTAYDALNRPITLTTPDQSVIQPAYNEANLLESLKVNLRGAETATLFVANINYNARGQRERIEYNNGTRTEYAYDEKTFRLTTLKTLRRNIALQDLSYTYDPAGNITHMRDAAQQTVFFRNHRVVPSTDYVYDAIYRLIQATGREHLGQSTNGCPCGPVPTSQTDQPRVGLLHPGDGHAMGIYRESYKYDDVGNFLRLLHQCTDPHYAGWKREYQYNEPSLLEPAQNSNHLSITRVGETTEPYAYDIHGNLLQMPHLAAMTWDFKDQLQRVDLGSGGRAYDVYDASGQRVRKVHEHNGSTIEERIYLGGFEMYRKRTPGESRLERETLHIMDDKQRIALVETKTQDVDTCGELLTPLIRYQLGNHLGSASLELDSEGAVISYEEYYPYGSTSYQAGRSATEVSLKRYRYTGKERDEETGLYYHGARYYAPWLGRWVSCDPASVGATDWARLDQPYVYVENRPVIANDPDGRIIWFIVIGAVALTTLTVVSPANAPTSETAPTYASISDEEFAFHAAVNAVSLGAGAGASNFVFNSTKSLVVSGAAGGFTGGVIAAPGNQLVSDAASGDFRSPGDYLAVTAEGGFYGGLTGGAFGALGAGWSRLRAPSGTSSIPGRVPLGTPSEAAAFDEAAARLNTIIREGGPFPQETRGVGAAIVDVPGYTGAPELRAFSAAATDVIGEGAAVTHATVPANRIFAAARSFRGAPGGGIPRINDVEVKLLTQIADDLPANATGTIHLSTLRSRAGGTVLEPLPACPSCTSVIFQFTGDFPGVQVVSHAASNPAPLLDLFARPLIERLFPGVAAFLGTGASTAATEQKP